MTRMARVVLHTGVTPLVSGSLSQVHQSAPNFAGGPTSVRSRAGLSSEVIARRLTTLLAAASLLHLTMVGRDIECSSHEDQPAANSAMQGMHSDGSHKGHERPAKSGNTPAALVCCQVMASCGIALNTMREGAAAAAGQDAESASVVFAVMPQSNTRGPEPPPPKA